MGINSITNGRLNHLAGLVVGIIDLTTDRINALIHIIFQIKHNHLIWILAQPNV
jgi:hypothetical protein